MRSDAPTILMAMGFDSLRDFHAAEDGAGGVKLDWLSKQTQPTRAEIDAYALTFDPALVEKQRQIDEAKTLSLRDRGVILAVAEVVGIDGAALIAKVESHISAEGAKA